MAEEGKKNGLVAWVSLALVAIVAITAVVALLVLTGRSTNEPVILQSAGSAVNSEGNLALIGFEPGEIYCGGAGDNCWQYMGGSGRCSFSCVGGSCCGGVCSNCDR